MTTPTALMLTASPYFAVTVAVVVAFMFFALFRNAHARRPALAHEQEASLVQSGVLANTFAMSADDVVENHAWNNTVGHLAHEQYRGGAVQELAEAYGTRCFAHTWIYWLQGELAQHRNARAAARALAKRVAERMSDTHTPLSIDTVTPVSYVNTGLYGATYLVHYRGTPMVLKWMRDGVKRRGADESSLRELEDTPWSNDRDSESAAGADTMAHTHVRAAGADPGVKCLVFSTWFVHVLCTALANHLVLARLTPCLVLHYEARFSKRAGGFYACMEQMDGAFRDGAFFHTLLGRACEPEDVDVVLFHVCHALAVAYQKFRMQHHDMHAGNILLQVVAPVEEHGGEAFEFSLDRVRYHVPNRGFLAKVADWDIAQVHVDATHTVSSNHAHLLRPRLMSASLRMLARKLRKKPHCAESACLARLQRALDRHRDVHPVRVVAEVFAEFRVADDAPRARSPYLFRSSA